MPFPSGVLGGNRPAGDLPIKALAPLGKSPVQFQVSFHLDIYLHLHLHLYIYRSSVRSLKDPIMVYPTNNRANVTRAVACVLASAAVLTPGAIATCEVECVTFYTSRRVPAGSMPVMSLPSRRPVLTCFLAY